MDIQAIKKIPITMIIMHGVLTVRSAYNLINETKPRSRENYVDGVSESSNLEHEERNRKKLDKVRVPSKL
jgi:hypothetical protein